MKKSSRIILQNFFFCVCVCSTEKPVSCGFRTTQQLKFGCNWLCLHISVIGLSQLSELIFIIPLFVSVIPTEMKKLEEEYNAIRIPNEESVVTYYKIRQQLAKLGKEIEEFIHKPRYCLPFLQPGRLVRVNVQWLFIYTQIQLVFHPIQASYFC